MIGNGTQAADRSGFTIPYHIFRIGGTMHWCFWFGLPIVTSLQIWVGTGHRRPLPTFTTWRRGLGDTEHIVSGGLHPAWL